MSPSSRVRRQRINKPLMAIWGAVCGVALVWALALASGEFTIGTAIFGPAFVGFIAVFSLLMDRLSKKLFGVPVYEGVPDGFPAQSMPLNIRTVASLFFLEPALGGVVLGVVVGPVWIFAVGGILVGALASGTMLTMWLRNPESLSRRGFRW